MALNSLNSMKNGIEITEFNAKFWAIFEILDFKGSQLADKQIWVAPLRAIQKHVLAVESALLKITKNSTVPAAI